MNDDQYWDAVDTVITSIPENVGTSFAQSVVMHWRNDIAPEKHADYGIECWERLGPRALVADLSACFYRYKKLWEPVLGAHSNPAMKNAIVDAFGYAVLYAVCKYTDRGTGAWDKRPPYLSEIYWREMFETKARDEDIGYTNEQLIRVAWDGYETGFGEGIAMRQAYNMWRGLPV